MRTENYIAELLYRYNCIVVPNFGAFLTRSKSAVLIEDTQSFYPPTKVISFNKQLTDNDGILVSYIASAEETNYEVALENVTLEVHEWKRLLKEGTHLVFDDIGKLWQNKDGKLLFEPQKEVNYLTSSFGLTSFVSNPVTREVLKEEVVQLEEKIPFMITPEQRKKGNYRPFLKYAAVVLLALSAGFASYTAYNRDITTTQLAEKEAKEFVNQSIQTATFFDSAPLELPAVRIATETKAKPAHHVIAGAFRDKKNAERKVNQLRRKGFEATIVGTNKFGLHQVAYASFVNAKEALKSYRTIRNTVSDDAWILSVK